VIILSNFKEYSFGNIPTNQPLLVKIDPIADTTYPNQLTFLKMITVFRSLANVSSGVALIFTGDGILCKDLVMSFGNDGGKFFVSVFILLDMVLMSLATQRNGRLKRGLPVVSSVLHSISYHRELWRLLLRRLFMFWTDGNDGHQNVTNDYSIVYGDLCAPLLLQRCIKKLFHNYFVMGVLTVVIVGWNR
jgi:hypothetical protein